jgi:pimeloyl-ACP methyl ester carboxylesterase
MADAATFVEYLQKTIKGAESSKAIVASGSYGGFLATVFRQNHPEAFFGAIASAPPIEGLIDDSSDPYRYNWNIWLNNVYQDRSVLGSSKIKTAFLVLKQRFATGNLSSLKQELGLCSIPTDDQFIQLSFWMQNVYSNAAELNYAALRPGRAPTTLAFDKVIDIALKQDDPIQILNETLWLWYGPSPDFGLPCINITAPIASVSVPLIESTIFEYIVCES